MRNEIYKTRTLVFVPNTYCNLGCSYCYLGTHTNKKIDTYTNIASNLKDIVNSFLEQGVLIETFSLHGAEPTTIPRKYLEELFSFIKDYHKKYKTELRTFGSKQSPIHIKTNLYNFSSLKDLFEKYNVTISGSVDLPLSLHEKYRPTKTGKSTVNRILKSIKLLTQYKSPKGLSCVITKEHLEKFDEFVKDVKYLHEELNYDMINSFYVMFAYDSVQAKDKFKEDFEIGASQLTNDEMVEFYRKVKKAFVGTQYEKAIYYNWFKEFVPNYCTTFENCGTTFLLVQKNGDAYPCHRAQPDETFKFGNVFKDGLKKVLQNAPRIIENIENTLTMDKACTKCDYFQYCYLGCPVIRKDTKAGRSYTCGLQKEVYKDNPKRFPVPDQATNRAAIDSFIRNNNVKIYDEDIKLEVPRFINDQPELFEEKNNITSIIKKDINLQSLYEHSAFKIQLDEQVISLQSPILKTYDNIYKINKDTKIKLHIKKSYFDINCYESLKVNNCLMMMMLRNTLVVYGDEQRTKQEHIFYEAPYYSQVKNDSEEIEDYYVLDISEFIHKNNKYYIKDVMNNLFFTTDKAREYHYKKQAKNAFYHLQAINLPFHNFMFFYEGSK